MPWVFAIGTSEPSHSCFKLRVVSNFGGGQKKDKSARVRDTRRTRPLTEALKVIRMSILRPVSAVLRGRTWFTLSFVSCRN